MTYSTDWKETIRPDESVRFEQYAERVVAMRKRAEPHRSEGGRAFHARGLAGVHAEFHVLPRLPEQARVGIFAAPATYPAWARFSNGNPMHRSDRIGDIRGFALKVMGVPGKKLLSGFEAPRTQDFLMIQSPVLPFRDTAEFMFFVDAMASPATAPVRLLRRFGVRRVVSMLGMIRERFGRFTPTLAGQRFWTPVPIQWGSCAAKYGVVPAWDPSPPARHDKRSRTFLADELADRLACGPVAFDFRVQFFVDERRTPIEDASVDWLESVSPPVTVARVVLPQQDVRSEEGLSRGAAVERMSFDPWHAPEAFRPLGDIMRARRLAYRASATLRGATPDVDAPDAMAGISG